MQKSSLEFEGAPEIGRVSASGTEGGRTHQPKLKPVIGHSEEDDTHKADFIDALQYTRLLRTRKPYADMSDRELALCDKFERR